MQSLDVLSEHLYILTGKVGQKFQSSEHMLNRSSPLVKVSERD